ASPISATLSLKNQGAQRMVTSEPVGLLLKSSSSEGMRGTASGNSSAKNRRTASSVLVVLKLRGPSNSQKSVHVNEPSGFGSAIIRIALGGFDNGGIKRGTTD